MKQQALNTCSSEFNNYWRESGRRVHGGEYAKGKRKTARPFDRKRPIHIVMRASQAKGARALSSPQNRAKVKSIIESTAVTCGLTLYRYSINSNHLHLLVRTKDKKLFQKFLRAVSGWIARLISGARRGLPKGRFWDALTFTRLADWGRPFENLKNYVVQNILESAGAIAYRPRKNEARGGQVIRSG